MPDLSKSFDSEWVKARVNTQQGDNLRFLDKGTPSPDPKNMDGQIWTFRVAIIRNGQTVATKKFQLNKSNFNAISKRYGTDSDQWEGKEMYVNIIKTQTPAGELVSAVRLSPPGEQNEVDTVQVE